MANIAVVYRSRYGHARDYAGWIAAELGADLLEGAKPERLLRYDTLIFGGGLYAGGIGGARLLRDNFERLRDKHLVVFTVGLTATGNSNVFQPAIDRAFSPDMQQSIRFFHLRGGIDYKRLSLPHRSMMRVLRIVLGAKRHRTSADDMILETYGGRVDFRDKASTRPLVEYVKSLESGGQI